MMTCEHGCACVGVCVCVCVRVCVHDKKVCDKKCVAFMFVVHRFSGQQPLHPLGCVCVYVCVFVCVCD